MIPYFHCLWRYGRMLGRWMRPVLEIQARWNIRLLIWQRAIGFFILALFMAQTISGSSSLLFMPWHFVGIRGSTTRPSTQTPITPFSGLLNASARQNWSAPPRQNNSIRLSSEQKTGLIPTISVIPSSNGKPRNGERFLPISAGNKPRMP